MNDLYSFHTDKEDLEKYYWEVAEAYKKIFSRLGLDIKVVEAAGGGFTSEYTHEFQVITPSGEDTIFYCATCDFAQNKEIAKIKDGDMCPSCDKEKIIKGNGIEVGNIFKLGTKFSEPLGLTFKDEEGNEQPVIMGSYGIGLGRLMGTVVEVLADEKGIIWSE